MKIIVSSDRQRIINFEQIQDIYIGIFSNRSVIYAQEDWLISEHKQLENAKKQLQEIINVMTADGPVVYQAEDTE